MITDRPDNVPEIIYLPAPETAYEFERPHRCEFICLDDLDPVRWAIYYNHRTCNPVKIPYNLYNNGREGTEEWAFRQMYNKVRTYFERMKKAMVESGYKIPTE